MIHTVTAGILCGAALGTLSGWASRAALKKVLDSADKVFYSVFVAGFFCRLALLAGAVCLLRHEKYIIVVAFAFVFILVQTGFEAFPLKHGPKTNT